MKSHATMIVKKSLAGILLMLFLLLHPIVGATDQYSQRRDAVQKRDATRREVPVIPPKDQVIRVLIDTDARNEIDDILRCHDIDRDKTFLLFDQRLNQWSKTSRAQRE